MDRSDVREEFFKLLFELEVRFAPQDKAKLLEWQEEVKKRDYTKYPTWAKDFVTKYSDGISNNYEAIRQVSKDSISGWSIERIGNVERTLIYLGIYEINYEELPKEVVINEVVELAKKYGDNKTSEFVHGVIGKIIN